MKLRRLAFLVALVVTPACAGVYDSCFRPYASEITFTGTFKEAAEIIGGFLLCDPAFNGSEVPACVEQDLDMFAPQLGPDATAIENCVIAQLEKVGTVKQQAVAHAVAVKRGIHSASLRCEGMKAALRDPGDSKPPEGPTLERLGTAVTDPTKTEVRPSLPGEAETAEGTPSAGARERGIPRPDATFAYAGPLVSVQAAACIRKCGSQDAVSTPDGCMCLLGHGVTSRWVAAR